ncbi:glucokinase [Candidatus Colwellia aromaticivorans]|uniref:glucokinase n=1 Tax=Candidatus Colwellia aromaticivorans TaxID=2267621 RepID=UPI000DF2CD17|nr:glucokinase [Candidatus Colwellia aromaticivorans]
MNLYKKNKHISLIADIGGTNIRIGQTNKDNLIISVETYQCANFNSLYEVLAFYIDKQELDGYCINACLAIACPVDSDWIAMTNLSWQFSQKQLQQQLKFNSLVFINDYTAIAMAIPFLVDSQKVKIGGGNAVSNNVISVCGPGTGLGVANLIPISNSDKIKWQCVSGEGGHVDFAPVDDIELKIFDYLKHSKKRISYEQLLSGYGLEQIYQALLFINGSSLEYSQTNKVSSEIISKQAVSGSCELCVKSLSQFCKVLGSFAGNLALQSCSLGGVYIAGGIVPNFITFIKDSDFRVRFEEKGRLSGITKQTPTYIITEPQPGLLGASAYLNQLTLTPNKAYKSI